VPRAAVCDDRAGDDRDQEEARVPARSSATRPRAVVIGGSIGGLFAASLLRAAGWEATVFERSRGAGVGITAELLDAMRRIGLPFDPSIGVSIRSYAWLDATGATVHEHPRPMVASAWSSVYRPLRAAFPDRHYRTGTALARIEQDAGAVTAVFEDGSRAAGDLLVAADGVQSTARAQLSPGVAPRYAGYVAWRGVVDEDAVSAATRRAVAGHIAFSFHDGELMLTMLVPGADDDVRPGRRRFYFIWYRPTATDAELADLFTDATGRHHGASIPPPLIRPELQRAIRARAPTIFAPALADVVARAPRLLLQAITDLETPELVFGRVALIGDAAFVARPHVAAGITKAALNAAALADAVGDGSGDLAAALARYDADARAFGAAMVAHARALGSYVESRSGQTAGPADPRFLDPLEVMREYGAPRLLHDADPAAFRPPDAAAGG
jgi:2-polyprenyl-6-methoxyphenol hydroxylase-like FAD-dependent oxidoreductase